MQRTKKVAGGWTLASELHKLVVERRSHFHGEASHDVLDQLLSEGDAVECGGHPRHGTAG